MLLSEVYSAYFRALELLIKAAQKGELTEENLQQIIEAKAFSESALTIIPAIKNEEWLVINQALKTPLCHVPQMPLTLLQKRWLKTLLADPRCGLFGVTAQGLSSVDPLWQPEDLVYFDRYTDGDDFSDPNYIACFKTILEGLKKQCWLKIVYLNRQGRKLEGSFIPSKLEYSAKDDKFRLKTMGNKLVAYINVARITSCQCMETYERDSWEMAQAKRSRLKLWLKDERNALDRVLLHFSDCQKETRRLDSGEFEMVLWYDRQDETEILIRILSFGPMIKVLAPQDFVELIKKRLKAQGQLT